MSFLEWVFDTYYNQLNLDKIEGSKKYHKFIESLNLNKFGFSGASRIQNYHIIKYGYPMRCNGYIVGQVTARINVGGQNAVESCFANIYWPRGVDTEEPEYICMSSTFVSRDGEYRHRFVWYKQWIEGYENLIDALSLVEKEVLRLIGSGLLSVDITFYPENEEYPSEYCENNRLALKIMTAALLLDACKADSGTLQNHASDNYVEVMKELYEESSEVLREAIGAKYGKIKFDNLYVFVNGLENQPTRAQCGQKIMPLTVREALQINDMNYAPWREIYVARAATDLIINGIGPMFSIYNNWTFIEGTNRHLFENDSMLDKYLRSDKAKAMADSLRTARKEGAADKDYSMTQLDAHIYDSILYAQDFILLTDIVLLSTCEHVGMTIKTIPAVIRKADPVAKGLLRIYSEASMQARYLFDLCYGVHMLHTKIGVIHADLHMNNMTILEKEHQYYDNDKEEFHNPVISYIAGELGETETYVFPHDGFYSCIIDFSRSIIGPTIRPQLAEEKGEDYAAGFYRHQVSRALRVLHHYEPEFTKTNQEKIKALLLSYFDKMFNVMTAVDYLAIGHNMRLHFSEVAKTKDPTARRQIEVAPEGIKLAANIESMALDHLIVNLTRAIEGGPQEIDARPLGSSLLRKAFHAFLYTSWAHDTPSRERALPTRPWKLEDSTLTDVYNGTNKLKYSSADYADYPPWARFNVIEKHLGGLDIGAITSNRGDRPFLRSTELCSYGAVLQSRLRSQVSDRPGAETSSWIAD